MDHRCRSCVQGSHGRGSVGSAEERLQPVRFQGLSLRYRSDEGHVWEEGLLRRERCSGGSVVQGRHDRELRPMSDDERRVGGSVLLEEWTERGGFPDRRKRWRDPGRGRIRDPEAPCQSGRLCGEVSSGDGVHRFDGDRRREGGEEHPSLLCGAHTRLRGDRRGSDDSPAFR